MDGTHDELRQKAASLAELPRDEHRELLFEVSKTAGQLAAFPDDESWALALQLWRSCDYDDYYRIETLGKMVREGDPTATFKHLRAVVENRDEQPEEAETIIFELGERGSAGGDVASGWWPLLWAKFEADTRVDWELLPALAAIDHPEKGPALRRHKTSQALPHPLEVALQQLGSPDSGGTEEALRSTLADGLDWEIIGLCESAAELDIRLTDEIAAALREQPDRIPPVIADIEMSRSLRFDAELKARLEAVWQSLLAEPGDVVDTVIGAAGMEWTPDEDPIALTALLYFLGQRRSDASLKALQSWVPVWEQHHWYPDTEHMIEELYDAIDRLTRRTGENK